MQNFKILSDSLKKHTTVPLQVVRSFTIFKVKTVQETSVYWAYSIVVPDNDWAIYLQKHNIDQVSPY